MLSAIASNDNEWRECLNEAKELHSPKRMRNLFDYLCALNVPANALALVNEFKVYLSEDFLRVYNEEAYFNRALLETEDTLNVHNLSSQKLGLPVPTYLQRIEEANAIDPIEQEFLFCEHYETANIEQRNPIGHVIREVLHHDTGSNVFCLTAHAGCGKTFTQTAIITLSSYCFSLILEILQRKEHVEKNLQS
ncbi:hypothetical protein AVEN_138115-1 [Araneus ventricosus]|uniref:ATP-dependent DNA helicase n=1 Tax=Araneus ventricosus TaxID=182803 RepID=A0A4Y2TYR7_ARAVE|nr:hypothetical protein AVEN_138115-1 [Araneus ventricosus]